MGWAPAMSAQRIQRQRKAGWRMPEGAVYVGRGSQYGNPFRVKTPEPQVGNALFTPAEAVRLFRQLVDKINQPPHKFPDHPLLHKNLQRALRGKTLACWCACDQVCHADVLLEIANKEAW